MAKSKTRRVKAFVVHRRDWEYNDEYHEAYGPGTPIQTFLSREKDPEAYRLEKERKARKDGAYTFTNPFELQGLDWDEWTSVSQRDFDKRMREVGVEPLGRRYAYEWWEEIKDDLTDEQRNAIWDLLDQIYLYEVIETEVELEE